MAMRNRLSKTLDREHAIGAAAPTVKMLDEQSLNYLDGNAMRVISALIGNPTTTRQVALRLGMHTATVQHIIDQLIRSGTATLFRERVGEHAAERYYTIPSTDVVLQLATGSSRTSQLAGVEVAIETVRNDFVQLLCNDTHVEKHLAMLELIKCKMNASQAHHFLAKLRILAQEFNDAEDLSEDTAFALAISLYPSPEQGTDRSVK